MILIFGGTTEGRMATRVLEESGKPYYYSTKSAEQTLLSPNCIRLTGALNEEQMLNFCREKHIHLLIDAAHPFAIELHRTIAAVAQTLLIPSIRLERIYPQQNSSWTWCKDYEEAIEKLQADNRKRLLALTGVQTIGRLRKYWQTEDETIQCFFRVLERQNSVEMALHEGFPKKHLLFYHAEENEADVFLRIAPDAILTKESGLSGGFCEKIEAAQALNIPIYVIRRPILPDYTITVTGPHGLRKAVEQLIPDFYPLRSGFTTGTCATAAAKAALVFLLTGERKQCISISLPDGEEVTLPVKQVELLSGKQQATAMVVKDAGDDPDVTNGYEIGATIGFTSEPGIHFLQGEGVGRVTLPGLGIPIGQPAINPVPQKMIIHELLSLYAGGLNVTIFVPQGKELAQRTFNPKLGIIDGISILGTSGIVRPFSTEAFVNSIRREIEVCAAMKIPRLVINSGAKSEHFVKVLYPELPAQAFVHYGNFIGETLKLAAEIGIKQVSMGIMLGKAVKLAEGNLNTHSKQVLMNKDFLKRIAKESGCSAKACQAIEQITLARELWTSLSQSDALLFFPYMLQLCRFHTAPLLPNGDLTLLLIDETGVIRYNA